jgi:3-deoxy-7-phosphoheptulonate synthase
VAVSPSEQDLQGAPAEVTAARRVARERRPAGSRVVLEGPAGPVALGGPFVVMAGPCAVEGAASLELLAAEAARAGCAVLRGGAYKPRTSPYSFQGLGDEGVRLLAAAAARHGLCAVSEVMDAAQLPHFAPVQLLQVGARNMQNFALLKALAKERRPVLLKRGMASTVEEWLLAAEYLLDGGNDQVVLCERGIRTFESATRNTLDLSAVVLAKQRTHLPVIVDPSHACGRRELVIPLSLAAAAAGADGLLIEVHGAPDQALCDGPQALLPAGLQELMQRLAPLLGALGRELWRPPAAAPRRSAR